MHAAGRAVLVGAVAVGGALSFACGGNGAGDGATPPAATATGNGAPTRPPTGQTPGSFEQARQSLIARLQDYSATIGALPDDLLAELLAQCDALAQASDDAAGAQEICADIERAARVGDPGLVDRAIDRLGQLQPS
jgi:hypothetical protein